MVPSGLVLWWRSKRASIHWRRVVVQDFLAGLFLWIAAFTGMLIEFPLGEDTIYALTHSTPPAFPRPPASTPVPGAVPVGVDRAIAVAQKAIPNAAVDLLMLPLNPTGVYRVILRLPEETSGNLYLGVAVDQFSGQPLAVHTLLRDSEGYRWIRLNRSIHAGDIGGLAGHIVVSLSSLLLVAMVVTGVLIWLKKLAV